MTQNEVIRRAADIITGAGLDDVAVDATNWLDYSNLVRDIIKSWPAAKVKKSTWLPAFALQLRKMRDDFSAMVESDPLLLYKPAHPAALGFHESRGLVRYYRAPNRCSKTQAAVQDNYWVATGQHPYRPLAPLPAAVGVIGTSFSKYCPQVFETKYLLGESGNPLSPAFPEGGKWLHHYDSRKHVIFIACVACAEKRKASSCKHTHSRIILFSDNEGPLVMAGGQYSQLHLDEQVSQSFFPEGIKRLETVRNSGMVVTETPLGGRGFWTHKILTRDALAKKTVADTTQPLVTLHTIDQFAAGLTSHDRIHASIELMSPAEIEARVYGRPAAFSERGVFDANEISKMHDECTPPLRGELAFPLEGNETTEAVLQALVPGVRPEFSAFEGGNLRVWDAPTETDQYIIGVDVAQGLIKGDASSAQVLRMDIFGTTLLFTQVAKLHGWINPRTYAEDVMRLAVWYNEALVVPERNGPGHEFIRSLKEFGYWNIFRDVSDTAQQEFQADPILGITTTGHNKSAMISALQQTIKDRKTGRRTLAIRDADTVEELGTFTQDSTEKGNVSFSGLKGMHDDDVMALVVGVYAAKAFGVGYDYNINVQRAKGTAMSLLSQHEREAWDALRREEREDKLRWESQEAMS